MYTCKQNIHDFVQCMYYLYTYFFFFLFSCEATKFKQMYLTNSSKVFNPQGSSHCLIISPDKRRWPEFSIFSFMGDFLKKKLLSVGRNENKNMKKLG